MSETPQPKRNLSPDWFVQGTLTKIGDILDRLTGRRWKPGSSLATSELIERLKTLLDAEMKTDESGRRFVPHNIKLKMQWDKFSTDAEASLRALENEMIIAVIDHINDCHYYTYSPISIEVKPDYFTDGVKLFVSFEKQAGDDAEREIEVSVPGDKKYDSQPAEVPTLAERKIRVRYTAGEKPIERVISLTEGKRLSIGRTKENDIAIDHQSISKYHAAIVLNSDKTIVVADTGSTNGTFVGDERIPYGKAIEIISGKKMAFGSVAVTIDVAAEQPAQERERSEPKKLGEAKTEVYSVGEFQFAKKKSEVIAPAAQPELPKTEAAIHLPVTQAAIEIEKESN